MVSFKTGLVFALAAIAPVLALGEDTPPPPPTLEEVRPILAKHCFACHGNQKMRGDLNLERFENEMQMLEEMAVFNRSESRIVNNEMPPRTKPKLEGEERDTLLAWFAGLKDLARDCNTLISEGSTDWYPGYVMSRRLNRFEYENTLRDLLGISLDIASIFPADGAGGEGFDTDGSALFLSAIQAEKYLDAADMAIEAAFAQDEAGAARRAALMPHTPEDNLAPLDAARRNLTRFLQRAWRRPVRPVEVGHLLALTAEALDNGEPFEQALKLSYKAALVSPNFLFLAEPKPAESGVYKLGDYPLASRLSYFLWASMPDEELFASAERGELQQEEVLRMQISRMLDDPRAKALGDQFAAQWLGISQLGINIRLDNDRFPEFTPGLARDMREEAAVFFHVLFAENRSLLELLDTNYTYANSRLARIYGIPGVEGEHLQRVQLADNRRGGVLGMSAILAATSQPLRTSPVLRGKWVLEQLLGDHVPPPPPGAGALPADDKPEEGLTLRQRLEAHRSNPDCAACHSRMDPLGFGLENFDPLGRWREDFAGQVVDSRGELPTGEVFTGPAELKQILLARKHDFARNLARKMLGYALGRTLTMYDDCVIDDCVETLNNNGYQARSLVETIVLSYPFRHRYSAAGS
jgi:hypothetical protein